MTSMADLDIEWGKAMYAAWKAGYFSKVSASPVPVKGNASAAVPARAQLPSRGGVDDQSPEMIRARLAARTLGEGGSDPLVELHLTAVNYGYKIDYKNWSLKL